MNLKNKKFITCFLAVTTVALIVQILGEDIPFLGKVISTTQATDSEYDYVRAGDSLEITGYRGTDKEIIIPEKIDGLKVTSINKSAFSENGNITNISIPSTIKGIGDGAFKLCTGLVKVNIADGVKNIGDETFSGCTNLNEIVIPTSVDKIGAYAFADSGLNKIVIPGTVEQIGAYAFKNCYSLVEVSLSGGLVKIEDNLFENCITLSDVDIPGSVAEIGNMAFAGCIGLRDINIPASVSNIGQFAFEKCSSIENIDIPESVSNIGEYAFKDCSNLINISISSNIEIIYDGVFQNCEKLSALVIPENIKIIGADSFSGCVSLTDVTLSDNIKVICDRAFMNCNSITQVDIGDGTEIIGVSSFRNCYELESIYLGTSIKTVDNGAFVGIKNNAVITVPNGKKDEYTQLFSYDTNLTEGVVIIQEGDTVTTVEPTTEPAAEPDAKPVIEPSQKPDSDANTTTDIGDEIIPQVPEVKKLAVNFAEGDNSIVSTQTVNQGETVQLPDCGAENKSKFVGWIANVDGNNLCYPVNALYKPDTDITFTAMYIDLKMLDGGAIRLASSTGIRFSSRIELKSYDMLNKYCEKVKYGTIICPSDYIAGADDFTKESMNSSQKKFIEIPVNIWFDITQSYREFTGVITKIKSNSYNRNFSARAYVEITYADGSVGIIYSDYTDNNSRSVSGIAKSALQDNVYTKEQRNLLQSFIDGTQ